jgi:hypothetical protein
MNKGILLVILTAVSSPMISAHDEFPCVTEDTMLKQIAILQEIRDQNERMLNIKQGSANVAEMSKDNIRSGLLDEKVLGHKSVPSFRPDFEGLADRIDGL